MANEIAKRDQNNVPVIVGITDDASQETRMLRVDPVTGRLLVTGNGGGSGDGSFLKQLVSGTIDGVNTVFTIPTPIVGSSFIDLNGQVMADNGVDYTLSSTTITYVTAPPFNPSGNNTHYFYSGGGTSTSWVFDVPPTTGLVNSVNLIFTIPVVSSQVIVYPDGVRAKGGGVTYTFDGISTITFTAGNAPGSTLSIDYLPT